jgi:ADP-ribosylarginine hydrolase
LAWTKWPGALGVDSTLIAYDAILSCKGSWEEFCLRGILHGGDNDSTGTIGGAWFGALYGFKGVPKNHYQEIEDNKKLRYLAEKLF